MAARTARARALHWLVKSAAALGLALVFLISSGAALVLHVNQPAGRRLTAEALSDLLSDFFTGELQIGAIDEIGPRGIDARDIVVKDSAARTVLKVSRLRAQADVLGLVREILWGTGKTTLIIDHARVERAEALVLPSPSTGIPTLVEAFTPSEKPLAPGEIRKEPRYVRVWLPVVEVGRGFARGHVGALPTLEAEVSGVRGSVLASPKGAAIDVVKFSTVGRGVLGADAKGVASLHIRVPGVVWSSFDGYLGEVQFGSVVRYDKQRLDVTLDVPQATPESARALWPAWPLHKNASAHIEGSGALPKLDVKGRFEVEKSVVSANGMVDLSGTLGADLDVEARNVDLRAVLPDAPETSIDLFSNVSVASSPQTVNVDVNGHTEPTTIAGIAIPAADIAGNYDQRGFEGRATVHEQGMPLRVAFTIKPNGTIDLEAESERFDMAKAERLKPHVEARGLTRANVKAHLENRELSADFSVDVQGFELGDVRLDSARVTGRSHGSIDKPELLHFDANLNGKGLRAGRFRFETVTASAQGPVTRSQVTATFRDPTGPNVSGKAVVLPGKETRLENVELEVHRDQARLSGRVARIDLGEGVVVVRDLNLSGAGGDVRGSLELRPGLLSLDARGENLDLDAMARILGLPRGQIGGKGRIEAELVIARDVRRGQVRLGLANATLGPFSDTSLSLRAALDGDEFSGDASGQIAALGAFGAVWDTELAGPITEMDSFVRATGSAEVQVQGVDLAYLAHLLPDDFGIDKIDGQASGSFRLTRDDPRALPNVSVLAQTQGLAITRSKPPGAQSAPPGLKGVDLVLSAHVDGESGDSEGTLQMKLGSSTLAALSAQAQVDLARVRQDPAELGSVLEQTPFLAKLVVDDRRFDDMPELVRPPGMHGTLRAEATVRGTYRTPTFDAKLELGNIRVGSGESVEPIDVCADLEYEKETGRFGGRGQVFLPSALAAKRDVCGGRRVAQLSAGGIARWEDLTRLDDEGGTPRWTGNAGAMLEGLPLGAIAPLAEAHLSGRAFGAVMFERHELIPQLSAKLELRQATVDRMPIGDGKVVVHTGGNTLRGDVDFTRDGGALKASVLCALNWDGVIPAFDDTQPLTANVQAKKVNAALFEPLLTDYFTDLSGDVDANFALALTPLPKTEKGPRWTGSVKGTLDMNGGMVQLAGLALRLNDVRFSAVAKSEPNGTTSLAIRDLYAKALSNTDNLSGSATLTLRGLEIVSGRAPAVTFTDLPLVLEGVTHATADAQFAVDMKRLEKEMLVTIDVQTFRAELPRSSARELIELDDNTSIEMLQPVRETRPHRPADALPWRFRLALGHNTRIVRSDLSLPITGTPEIVLAEEAEVLGDIELTPGGRMQLLGKNFSVDAGEVHFDTGDSEDPRVSVLASWRAPEDTTVYVELRGRFKNLTMRTRSDPPLPESQIYALLLGGTTGEESGDVTASGVGAGADVLGALLADTPLNRVQLRTSNEQTADQRAYSSYTAAIQASETITVEGSYKDFKSQQMPGEDERGGSVGVDWRFHRNWSLRTEVGTVGTGLDLLWQYRY